MLIFLLTAALSVDAEPRVIARLKGDAFARAGIVAELVERPRGVSDEAFAQQLIDAEGLRPWNGEQTGSAPAKGRMGYKAVSAKDGRAIIVKYMGGDAGRHGRLCRLRLAPGPMSPLNWDAHRWCASKFGLTLPKTAPPIVRTNRRFR
jgi:hypothetical protein